MYRQGLRLTPNSLTLLYNLGRNCIYLSKFESSEVWFKFGLQIHPSWLDGLIGIAHLYFEMNDNEKAVKYIK